MTVLDLDAVEYVPAKNQRAQRKLGGSKGDTHDWPRVISIHTMECPIEAGRARSNANWQRDTGGYAGEQVSSHMAIDPGETLSCVHDDAVAFTQSTPWNDMCLSIEQTGYAAYGPEVWAAGEARKQIERVAQVCAAWCRKWGIPAVYVAGDELARQWRFVSGITTHYQITLASQTQTMKALGYKPGSHTDPGSSYPMAALIERVRVLLGPEPDPGEDDMPTEIRLIDSEGTHFVWNPPTNTFRWVFDGNVAAMQPDSMFVATWHGTIPNGHSVDEGVRSLIASAVKTTPAPNGGQFAGSW